MISTRDHHINCACAPRPNAGEGRCLCRRNRRLVFRSARILLAVPKTSMKIEERCIRPSKSADGTVTIIDRWGAHLNDVVLFPYSPSFLEAKDTGVAPGAHDPHRLLAKAVAFKAGYNDPLQGSPSVWPCPLMPISGSERSYQSAGLRDFGNHSPTIRSASDCEARPDHRGKNAASVATPSRLPAT